MQGSWDLGVGCGFDLEVGFVRSDYSRDKRIFAIESGENIIQHVKCLPDR